MATTLSVAECAFLDLARVAHLATADSAGAPHVVPICFARDGAALYMAVDGKPKRGDGRSLRRLKNIAENPQACVTVDRYDEDWSRLAWVMLRGTARILEVGEEGHARAQALLKARYPQLSAMDISGRPVVAIQIERVTSWGDLSGGP